MAEDDSLDSWENEESDSLLERFHQPKLTQDDTENLHAQTPPLSFEGSTSKQREDLFGYSSNNKSGNDLIAKQKRLEDAHPFYSSQPVVRILKKQPTEQQDAAATGMVKEQPKPLSKTLEERERDYAIAKAKIFNQPTPEQPDTTITASTTTGERNTAPTYAIYKPPSDRSSLPQVNETVFAPKQNPVAPPTNAGRGFQTRGSGGGGGGRQ